MNLFYSEDFKGDNITFQDQELQHLKVLRLEIGEIIRVIDGKGNLYEAKLMELSKKMAKAKMLKKETIVQSNKYYLHLAIAPTKSNDRIEFFLEKAIELGVNEVSFLKTERTEKKHLKPERMAKILLASCKQSKCYTFPKLNFDIPFEEITKLQTQENKYICHCLEKEVAETTDSLKEGSYLILVGPEGDFSPAEIDIALGNKFVPLGLGESRLRTETAGIYVCAVLRSNNI